MSRSKQNLDTRGPTHKSGQIKITLRGSHGGELDCRFAFDEDGIDAAIIDLVSACVFAIGDTITIEET